MASVVRWGRQLWKGSPSPPRQYPSSGFELVDSTRKVEEGKFEWYDPEVYYPVLIGQVFNSRYQVIGKLGYGAHSTVWLCRDLVGHDYVTLKVCERDTIQTTREVQVYKYLNTIEPKQKHPGSLLVRKMLDNFEVTGSTGKKHQCLVHKPLGINLADLQDNYPSGKYTKELLRATLKHVFMALDFLHTEAQVIHADLQPKNFLLGIVDKTILTDFEESELTKPSPCKIVDDRVIYVSRELGPPTEHGGPILSDFGEARYGQESYDDDIQPYTYRAPEVILDLPWNSKVDIWSVGVMVWDIFENKHMFHAMDEQKKPSSINHIAEMISVVGPPPKEFLRRCSDASRFFDSQGKFPQSYDYSVVLYFRRDWKGAVNIPSTSLEESEENLDGENKIMFLKFMRKMLQWAPEDRQSASELLEDPWLNG